MDECEPFGWGEYLWLLADEKELNQSKMFMWRIGRRSKTARRSFIHSSNSRRITSDLLRKHALTSAHSEIDRISIDFMLCSYYLFNVLNMRPVVWSTTRLNSWHHTTLVTFEMWLEWIQVLVANKLQKLGSLACISFPQTSPLLVCNAWMALSHARGAVLSTWIAARMPDCHDHVGNVTWWLSHKL
jgi:hypothetical protein